VAVASWLTLGCKRPEFFLPSGGLPIDMLKTTEYVAMIFILEISGKTRIHRRRRDEEGVGPSLRRDCCWCKETGSDFAGR